VPTKDGTSRVAAAEILVNTAAVRENIRDVKSQLNIPDLIKEGTVQYGMQSFDQGLMQWYTEGVISLESALFYCSNPTEFQLQVQGIAGSSDRTFEGFEKKGGGDPSKTGGGGLGAKRPPAPAATPPAPPPAPPQAGEPGVSGFSRDPFQR